MKRYKELLLLAGTIFALSSCSQTEVQDDEENLSETIEFKGTYASLGQMNASGNTEPQSRKVEDFAVNTTLDPTASMDNRAYWKLDVQIYKGGNPYADGEATFDWNIADKVWEPNKPIFFPNYTKQFVSAKLYPLTWQNRVELDQSTDALLLAQDVLTQNGANTVTIKPAHIPTIEMRHGHSMLNFILDDVDEAQIAKLLVYADGNLYLPYRVNSTDKVEYLLILPSGTAIPEIRLTTVDGANYIERIAIPSTQANVCYCLHVKGVELTLSTISIADWALGRALSGDYSASTSYPTFEGIPSETYTLYYDNGLKQDITFNANGERTIKPLGRTLIKVERNGVSVDVKIVLRSMVIDLMPYF